MAQQRNKELTALQLQHQKLYFMQMTVKDEEVINHRSISNSNPKKFQ